jgi:adenosine deaminase
MNLPVTVHAGEVGSAESVIYAIEHLNAIRIGHGVAAAKNIAAMKILADRKCVLEICPTSNKMLGVISEIGELPLRIFQHNGVQFVMCTDNPALCRTSMSEELFKVAKAFSLSISDVAEYVQRSADAAFADRATKEMISKKLGRAAAPLVSAL